MIQINKKHRSGNISLDEYITSLEDELTKRGTSAIHKFILSSNKVAKVFADDLELLSEGRISECKLLNADKDDKTVDRIMIMLKNNELFKQINDIAESLVPEIIEDKPEVESEIKLNPEENAFEQMQKRVKDKLNGKKG